VRAIPSGAVVERRWWATALEASCDFSEEEKWETLALRLLDDAPQFAQCCVCDRAAMIVDRRAV